MADALGNPIAFSLTPGQCHEITQAELLVEHCLLSDQDREAVQAILADKGFDSDDFVEFIHGLQAIAVIPSRKGRKAPRQHNEELYKERNKVERFFNRIKHYRRVATRYDKAAINYTSFLHVACIMVWLL